MSSESEPCQCPDARRWRAYWSAEEIGRRLAEELAPLQAAHRAAIFAACNDVRGVARMDNTPPRTGESFAELERRRNQV